MLYNISEKMKWDTTKIEILWGKAMKRLTENTIGCMANFCEAEDCVNYEADGCCSFERYRKLAYYEDMEEQGRLLILPCKVGDTVFELVPEYCDRRGKDMCNEYCDGWDTNCPDYEGETDICARKFCESMLFKIGKTVFLTSEEAEAALINEVKI